jgi:hypothetical protein
MIMIKNKYLQEDITDSPEDREKLKPDQSVLQLPELKDIPGAGRSGKNIDMMPANTTISSADEEADELFDEDTISSENDVGSSENDVSPLEKKLLSESLDSSYDTDLPVGSISLDDEDEEGELLEEGGQSGDLFGKDLDDELVKEEDEESDGETQQ